jgi:hypothetical protein
MSEKSCREARFLQVLCVSGLRPVPGVPILGRTAVLRVVQRYEVSLLFTTGEKQSKSKTVREHAEHGKGLAPLRIRTSQPEGCSPEKYP